MQKLTEHRLFPDIIHKTLAVRLDQAHQKQPVRRCQIRPTRQGKPERPVKKNASFFKRHTLQ